MKSRQKWRRYKPMKVEGLNKKKITNWKRKLCWIRQTRKPDKLRQKQYGTENKILRQPDDRVLFPQSRGEQKAFWLTSGANPLLFAQVWSRRVTVCVWNCNAPMTVFHMLGCYLRFCKETFVKSNKRWSVLLLVLQFFRSITENNEPGSYKVKYKYPGLCLLFQPSINFWRTSNSDWPRIYLHESPA